MTEHAITARQEPAVRRPRVGFLGVGWIGCHRMRAIADGGTVDAAAIADSSPATAARAAEFAPEAKVVSSLDDLLNEDVDGIVIATPTALHAEQCMQALAAGAAVFCQKPLGRNAAEARAIVEAARAADRLLAVDLSYRFTEGMRLIRNLVQRGELGQIFAIELAFHNAYGPDKPWFYERALAGGGCVMDLGIHLVDLALWVMDFPRVTDVSAKRFADGEPLTASTTRVEDYALATLTLETGTAAQLSCSWRLPAGCDAVISAAFYGTKGGAALRNVNGSFYDFVAERFHGTAREALSAPPDAWFGRAAVDWAARLAAGDRFDPAVERVVAVTEVLDRIYSQ